MNNTTLTRNKPYILRALHNWIEDQGFTTDIIVLTSYPHINVPKEFINQDGTIILNISLRATRFLNIGNDYTKFTSRFNGKEVDISFPTEAIAAIQLREEKQLFPMDMLSIEEVEENLNIKNKEKETTEKEEKPKKRDRSHLSIVKD